MNELTKNDKTGNIFKNIFKIANNLL